MKTWKDFKKWWLHNRKLIRLFVSSKILKPIRIDLSRKTNTTISQQINFIGKLEKDDGTTILLIAEKQQKLFWTLP